MSNLKFAETHNLVAFLEKPEESDGIEGIFDFLNASSIRYVLTVNSTIYTSCIKQFWATAKAKTINGEMQIQALVDGKELIITETSVRRALQLKDAEGTECLPNATIFAELERMGEEKGFSGRITPLFETMMVQAPEELGEGSEIPIGPQHTPTIIQPSTSQPQKKQPRRKQRKDTKFLTWRTQRPLKLQRTARLKRLRKVGRSAQVVFSKDEGLGAHEDASKQGRKIADLDADAEVTLVDEAQERNDDNLMFDTGVFDEQEVKVEKVVSTTKVTTASTTTTTVDELTLAQTLIEIKAAKPKAVTIATTITTTTVIRPKARGVVV
ncbi:hypothetical protein Tco_0967716 [Tanacetum coccineum]